MKKKEEETIYSTHGNNFKSIRDWRIDDRPRERLLMHGAKSLSDKELLAILIGTGTRNKTALELADLILEKFNSFTDLLNCDVRQLMNINGIGEAKAVSIAAAFEIAKRIKISPFTEKKIFTAPKEIAEYYIPRFYGVSTETFIVLLLNSSNQIFREHIVSTGILNASLVHPREIFKNAIIESAASVILLHNHPSNNPKPSINDIEVTKNLKKSGEILGIPVLDHIIIAGNTYSSLKSMGLI